MKLTSSQLIAVEHFKGPAIVLAVPGAGKTTMILHRIKRLIDRGVDPKNILTITFSKAQAIDIKMRYNIMFGGENVLFSTIHAFCYSIVRDYSRKSGKSLSLIDSNLKKKYEILRDIYRDVNKTYPTEERIETAISEVGYCKNMMLSPNSFAKLKRCDTDNFVKFYETYEKYKKDKNLIDFDDMINLSYEILKSDASIRKKYRDRFKFIQLDEGQDTSRSQFQVLKLLAKPDNNLFVVADDDQSIYGFRGANTEELFNLQKEYNDIATFYMEENFRSTKNIVNIANIFIAQNEKRFDKTVFTSNPFAKPVNIIKVKEPKDQYEFIEKELQKGVGDIAVLYRNNLSSIGLVEYFERRDYDFNIKDKKTKFFSHFITKDILDILNFSRDLSDIDLYEKFYFKLDGYISKKHIEYLKKNRGKNIFNILKDYPGLPSFYHKNINKLLVGFRKIARSDVYEAINYIDREMGYGNYLKENSKRFMETEASLNEYLYYLKLIAKSTKTLDLFIGRLKELEYDLLKSRNDNAKLTFSTIHSAKGLEFSRVFVVDLYEGTLPSTASIDTIGEDEELFCEERRLFYVAMTRAKKELYLMYSHYTNGRKNEISSFVTDLETLAGEKNGFI
ncbi:MAG: ATP-dependent helicase [Peptoniphilus sp.]|uniref:ATP-dependent helicase n=1 Tax=Peptoniphilus sp. TaxID=1971214 RepID=UPI0025FB23BD|nr:ATP-dependent helicase [Peptoniphilus sp.]MCI5643199.1 ATP-dependent helicase [Peptoniphilus sp.]MDD7352317.1 ATP-dependent helicase [Peptoniphilaceae bacterium]MDY3903187.1 ATP-dependent helicase [Peptoniphilus sp.]